MVVCARTPTPFEIEYNRSFWAIDRIRNKTKPISSNNTIDIGGKSIVSSEFRLDNARKVTGNVAT